MAKIFVRGSKRPPGRTTTAPGAGAPAANGSERVDSQGNLRRRWTLSDLKVVRCSTGNRISKVSTGMGPELSFNTELEIAKSVMQLSTPSDDGCAGYNPDAAAGVVPRPAPAINLRVRWIRTDAQFRCLKTRSFLAPISDATWPQFRNSWQR